MLLNRVITSLFATIFTVLAGTHALAGDDLRMVSATGRAVIIDQANVHEAKNIALEDALYLAALKAAPKLMVFPPCKPIRALMTILSCALQAKFLIIALQMRSKMTSIMR